MTPRLAILLALGAGGCIDFDRHLVASGGDGGTDAAVDDATVDDAGDAAVDDAGDAGPDARDAGGDAGGPVGVSPLFPWSGWYSGSATALAASAEGPADQPSRPTFRWRPGERRFVELSVAVDAAFETPVLGAVVAATAAAFTPPARFHTGGGQVHWRVRECDEGRPSDAACGAWSPARSFHLERLADDLDGDGASDVAIGVENALNAQATLTLGDQESGVLSTMRVPPPTMASNRFGASLAFADLSGDGLADLVVSDHETVRMYLGTEAPSSILLSRTAWTLEGAAELVLAAALDVDGDGRNDLFVGVPEAASAGTLWQLERSGRRVRPVSPPLPPGSRFGHSVATAGDFDGDGFGDVVVGAPATATEIAGAAYVLLGGPAGLAWARRVELRSVDLAFGRAVAGGDVDGDGFGDVAIASDGTDGCGVVRVFFGGPGEPSSPWTVSCALGGGTFGASVSLGDVDGDGLDDLAVGDPDRGVYFYPGARIRPGATAAAGTPVVAGALDGRFGERISLSKDVDGDGFADLVGTASSARAAFVILSDGTALGGPRLELPRDLALDALDVFGASLASAWRRRSCGSG